jgi:hypothetical protein
MFVKDTGNNTGRRCNLPGDGPDAGRHWVLTRAMTISGGHLCYLVRHDVTGECRVAADSPIAGRELPVMSSMY